MIPLLDVWFPFLLLESIQSPSHGLYTPYKKPPKFVRRATRVDNMADNADITQLHAANHHWVTWH